MNTLLNFGAGAEDALIDLALEYLLDTQSAGGSCPSTPCYYGRPSKAVSWGSPELTIGLCLEALAATPSERGNLSHVRHSCDGDARAGDLLGRHL